MNIQFRDCKTLQDALIKRSGRNMLPKAQLHPEMQNGLVECDRGGFTIRSEVLTGEHVGDANQVDVRNMADFMPEDDLCWAEWKVIILKQGDSFTSIPSELRFTFDRGGVLVIRTQAAADVTRLTMALPTDQRARFEVKRLDSRMTFTRARNEKPIATSHKSDAELQEEAAKAGVKWDKKASRETMIEKIEEARKASA